MTEEPILNGKQKKAQLREFERFMSYSRERNAYIIEKIYHIPTEKVDKRQGQNAKKTYMHHVQIQILHHLASEHLTGGTSFKFILNSKLYRLIGMFNDKYEDKDIHTKEAIERFIEEYPNQFTKFDVREFYRYSKPMNKRTVVRALDNLQSRWLINWEQKYRITEKGGFKSHISSIQEQDNLRSLKYWIARNMGLEDERDVYLKNREHDFYQRLNQEMLEKFGWTSAYAGFNITFNADQLPEQIEYYKKQVHLIEDEKHALNSAIHAGIVKAAESRYKSAKDAHDEWQKRWQNKIDSYWGEVSTIDQEKEPYLYDENYVPNRTNLANLLIRLNRPIT